MRKGFTLVELSIVLVIIGLLIGGILAAQSMISAAKYTKAAQQLTQLDIAVGNFKTKYNQWPGDSNIISPQGNNDTMVAYDESFNAWVHLSTAMGLKNARGGDYQTIAWSGNGRTDVNCPDLDLPKYTGTLVAKRCIVLASTLPGMQPWLNMETGNLGDGTDFYYAFRPIDLMTLDKKVDDGNGNTGVLIANWNNGACIDGGGNYQLNTATFVCSGIMYIGGMTTKEVSR